MNRGRGRSSFVNILDAYHILFMPTIAYHVFQQLTFAPLTFIVFIATELEV
jgi:hypothetical protein